MSSSLLSVEFYANMKNKMFGSCSCILLCRILTQSIGLLSYTFLRREGYDRIVVPMVSFITKLVFNKFYMDSCSCIFLYLVCARKFNNSDRILIWTFTGVTVCMLVIECC